MTEKKPYLVQMRYRLSDDWANAPGYVESEARAFLLMRRGREDYNGGMWKITKGDQVLYEDKKLPRVGFLKRLFPWL